MIIHYYSCSEQVKVNVLVHRERIATSKNYIQKVRNASLFLCCCFFLICMICASILGEWCTHLSTIFLSCIISHNHALTVWLPRWVRQEQNHNFLKSKCLSPGNKCAPNTPGGCTCAHLPKKIIPKVVHAGNIYSRKMPPMESKHRHLTR